MVEENVRARRSTRSSYRPLPHSRPRERVLRYQRTSPLGSALSLTHRSIIRAWAHVGHVRFPPGQVSNIPFRNHRATRMFCGLLSYELKTLSDPCRPYSLLINNVGVLRPFGWYICEIFQCAQQAIASRYSGIIRNIAIASLKLLAGKVCLARNGSCKGEETKIVQDDDWIHVPCISGHTGNSDDNSDLSERGSKLNEWKENLLIA